MERSTKIILQFLVVSAILSFFIACITIFHDSNSGKRSEEPVLVLKRSAAAKTNNTGLVLAVVVSGVEVMATPNVMRLSYFIAQSPFDANGTVLPFTLLVGDGSLTIRDLSFATYSTATGLTSGTISKYPFDDYAATILVSVIGPHDFDVQVELFTTEQYGWTFTLKEQSAPTAPLVKFLSAEVTFRRTVLFRLYPMFQILAFWGLNIAIVYYASSVLIWETRNLEAGLVTGSLSLLFGLPGFRNTAPQSPPIGCLLDFASFYWCMLSAVITAIAVFIRYTWNGMPKKDAAK